MEFVVYALCAASIALVLLWPKKERLAFALLLGSFALSAAIYLIAVAGSIVPAVAV